MRIKRKGAVSGTGGITVFMVLAVLTVAVFAVLTLSSALADLRLSEKNADQTAAYYQLESQAVATVAAIEQAWRDNLGDWDAFPVAAANAVPNMALWSHEDGQVAFSLEAEGGRSFEVGLDVLAEPGTDGRYVKITNWRMTPADFGEVISPMEVWH